jgi:pyruvate dehydrogenase E2 component (dihydrolipoamide acetyltransferase)
MDKGTLLEWKVAPGQSVHKGDVVAVVDTTKAAVDVEIWSDGTVQELLVDIGQEIPVGTPIMALQAPGDGASAKPVRSGDAGRSGESGKSSAQPEPVQSAAGVAVTVAADAPRVSPSPRVRATSPTEKPSTVAARQRVSPAARARAAELGVRLDSVAGTGAQGAVTLQDVERAGVAKADDTVMLELADLVRRCRAGSLRSSEMSDPTITVTNLGDQGVQQVFGVIYPPQVALVGFGRIADRPWVEDGKLTTMPVVMVSLSADHRVSDGHQGALFLMRVHALLQQPEVL